MAPLHESDKFLLSFFRSVGRSVSCRPMEAQNPSSETSQSLSVGYHCSRYLFFSSFLLSLKIKSACEG